MNEQDTIIAAAAKASYTTGMATVAVGLTVGEWAALIGIGATVTTLIANLWFRIRKDTREAREHQLRMSEFKVGLTDE
jgi:hypothetical protein